MFTVAKSSNPGGRGVRVTAHGRHGRNRSAGPMPGRRPIWASPLEQCLHPARPAAIYGKGRTGIALSLAVAAAWAPQTASAQTKPAAIANSSTATTGPGTPVAPGLSLQPSLEGTYDDNIYRTDDKIEPSVDDFILTPGLVTEYSKAFGRHDIDLKADTRYDIYAKASGRNRLRLDLNGQGNFRFGGACVAQPLAQYRRQRADYGDINHAIDNLQSFSTLTMTVSCPRTSGFFPSVAASRTTTRNATDFKYADQTTQSYTGGIGYNKPSLGSLLFYYTYIKSDRDTLALTNRIDRYGVRFQRAVVSRFATDIDLHWLNTRTNNPIIPEYNGPGWDASLYFRPQPALTFRIQTERKIVNDSLVPAGYALQSDYKGMAEWKISENSRINLSYEYDRRKFRRDPDLVFGNIDADRVNIVGAGLRRRIFGKAELSLDAQHIKRSTNSGFNEYRDNMVTLGAKASF